MKICFFDTRSYDRDFFCLMNKDFNHEFHFIETRLSEKTAPLAAGFEVVCSFVNDRLNEEVLQQLADNGTKLIALRSAGYNHVDLPAAKKNNLKVVRVPEYSPYAVAEHVVALLMTLNRKTHKAYNRVREGNFSLEGLVGFDLHGKVIGVIGTGKIGMALIKIMRGFGCHVVAYDIQPDNKEAEQLGFKYLEFEEVLKRSDVISLHVPLRPETKHIINDATLGLTKKGVVLINTGRGGLVDTRALISALKKGHLGGAGLDVYEEEENYFFKDMSGQVLDDDMLARLLTFPNVLLTSHQGFLTHEALSNIAQTTLFNISEFEKKLPLTNEVK
jgi:D-lactate dehydrogenase